jgi:hypothetical protein
LDFDGGFGGWLFNATSLRRFPIIAIFGEFTTIFTGTARLRDSKSRSSGELASGRPCTILPAATGSFADF